MNNFILKAKPREDCISLEDAAILQEKLLQGLSKAEMEPLLNWYIVNTRRILCFKEKKKMEGATFENQCDLAQAILGYALEQSGFNVQIMDTQKAIDEDVVGHRFLVVSYHQFPISYLVDVTYRQFFQKKNCHLNRFMYKDDFILIAPDPGFFICQSQEGRMLATTLIQNGFAPFNDQTIKLYGDSFSHTHTGKQLPQSKLEHTSLFYQQTFSKTNTTYSVSYEQLYHYNLILLNPMEQIKYLDEILKIENQSKKAI